MNIATQLVGSLFVVGVWCLILLYASSHLSKWLLARWLKKAEKTFWLLAEGERWGRPYPTYYAAEEAREAVSDLYPVMVWTLTDAEGRAAKPAQATIQMAVERAWLRDQSEEAKLHLGDALQSLRPLPHVEYGINDPVSFGPVYPGDRVYYDGLQAYVVRPGDTLYDIAARHGVRIEKLTVIHREQHPWYRGPTKEWGKDA